MPDPVLFIVGTVVTLVVGLAAWLVGIHEEEGVISGRGSIEDSADARRD